MKNLATINLFFFFNFLLTAPGRSTSHYALEQFKTEQMSPK